MKEIFGGIGFIVLLGGGAFGYIYNIIWLIDSWPLIGLMEKILNIASIIFFPPIGAIVGLYHYFI